MGRLVDHDLTCLQPPASLGGGAHGNCSAALPRWKSSHRSSENCSSSRVCGQRDWGFKKLGASSRASGNSGQRRVGVQGSSFLASLGGDLRLVQVGGSGAVGSSQMPQEEPVCLVAVHTADRRGSWERRCRSQHRTETYPHAITPEGARAGHPQFIMLVLGFSSQQDGALPVYPRLRACGPGRASPYGLE